MPESGHGGTSARFARLSGFCVPSRESGLELVATEDKCSGSADVLLKVPKQLHSNLQRADGMGDLAVDVSIEAGGSHVLVEAIDLEREFDARLANRASRLRSAVAFAAASLSSRCRRSPFRPRVKSANRDP